MKTWLIRVLASLLPGLIVSGGMIVWSYVLTGGWPPQYLLVSASIGGIASPLVWKWIAYWRDGPAETNEVERPE